MFIEYVGKLDKESILDEELFEELFDIEDDFEREKKIQELQDKAKLLDVGVRFGKLLKAATKNYKSALKELQVNPKDNQTKVSQFNNGVNLRTGIWTADMTGIRTWSERGTVVACNHPIYPTRILRNAETGKCKIELEFYVRGQWRKTIVDKKTISSANSIINLADNGIHSTSDNAKNLVRYLSDVEYLNEYDIQEQKSSGKLGWIDGTFLPYDDSIIFDNEDNLKSLVDSIQEVGNRQLWFDTVKKLRKQGRMEVLIYIAASLASVLVEPCGALPFIVDLWGDTGRGKTVALMLAISIWGNPNEGGYGTDAKASITAMEVRLNALNSLPMMIDDMAQIKNQEDDFSGLVYKWCAGHGKDRSNVTLGLNKQTSWQNCILTNAERSLVTETMQGGAVNRIIDVEMGDTPIFGDSGSEIANILRHNYGFCGREFVNVVQMLGEEEIRTIQKKYFEQIKEYTKKNEPKEEKQIIPMSILMAADEISEKYVFKDGVRLDFEHCVSLLKSLGEVSEHKRAYNYIVETVEMNRELHFEESENKTAVRWGTIENGYAIIIATVFNDLMKKGNFQDKAFLSWAKKNDLISSSGDRMKKQKRFDSSGSPVWCIWLKLPTEETDSDFVDVVGEIPFD